MVAKNIYTKLKNEFYREDVFWENEVKANGFVAKALLNLALVMAITVGLVIGGIVENPAGDSFMQLHTVTLPLIVLSAILCFICKGEKHWLKYLLCVICIMSVIAMNAVINSRTTLVLAIPILISCRYYDVKLTKIISVLTFIGLYISEYIYAVSGSLDLNSIPYFGGTVTPNKDGFNIALPKDGFDFSRYAEYRFKASVLPKTFFLLVISMACIALVNAVRKMVLSQEQITMKNTRIQMELSTAGTIQSNMIPCTFPMFPDRKEFDVYASMTPAKEVGGDFYDMFLIDDDHLALVMADVSDKGIPAALFMMVTKILISDLSMEGKSPAEVLYEMNNRLCAHNEADMFVTVWLGVYEISTGKLTASNAGHEYPVIKRNNGNYELFKDKHGLVVAGMEDSEYENYELMLQEGDALFIYTDGVLEANDANGKMYGAERMLEELNRDTTRIPEQVINDMKKSIDDFAKDADQFDDITMLSFLVKKAVV